MNIKFNYKKLRTPTFNNETWWGDRVYKGFNIKKNFVKDSFSYSEELKLFANYEIFVFNIMFNKFFYAVCYMWNYLNCFS